MDTQEWRTDIENIPEYTFIHCLYRNKIVWAMKKWEEVYIHITPEKPYLCSIHTAVPIEEIEGWMELEKPNPNIPLSTK